jgi:hypothetical protein
MLIGEFDDLMETEPFRPFELVIAHGRTFKVRGPDYAWHPPGSVRTVFVAHTPGRIARLIDLHYVTQVIFEAEPNGRARRRRR